MSQVSLAVEANFAGGTWTDITADVVGSPGVTIDWGMDGGRPDDNCARPGTCALTLRNLAASDGRLQGRYSPGHANARTGWDLNTPLRVTLHDEDDVTRTLGPYRVVEILPAPGRYGAQTVAVLAADWLDEAAEAPVVSSGLLNVDGQALITDLLTYMDRQPSATNLDAGSTVFSYPLANVQGRDDRVLVALKSIAQSEGGFVYLTGAGTLVFELRSRRAGTTTDAFTLSDTMHGLSAGRSRADLVNAISLTVHPSTVSAGLVVLGAVAEPVLVPAGVTVYLTLDYRDPDTMLPCSGLWVAPPNVDLDYEGNARADGMGTDLTSVLTVTYPGGVTTAGASRVTYLVLNTGLVDLWVTTLQVRGYAVVDRDPVTVVSEDSASIAAYGRRTLAVDMPYQADVNVASGLATYWRTLYADAETRATAVTCTIVSVAALVAVLLGVDIGTRVALQETMTALARSYWVQGIALHLAPGPVASLTLRLAPASRVEYWRLGVSGRSELGVTTTLGYA